MARPFTRWLIFALCLAVLLSGMVWLSARTLELESARRQAAEEAQRQERIRLGLWRMDALASALLIRENARPVTDYQSFYAPGNLVANSGPAISTLLPKGSALQPSPLLASPSDLVLLHFELTPRSTVATSPEVPSGNEWEMTKQWYAVDAQKAAAEQRLSLFNHLLVRHPEIRTPNVEARNKAPAPATRAVEPRVSKASPSASVNVEQSNANTREFTQRSAIVSKNIASAEPMQSAGVPVKSEASKNLRPAEKSAPLRGQKVAGAEDKHKDAFPAPAGLAGDFHPRWVEGELLLLREAAVDGIVRIQGVWLDLPDLKVQLLDTVRDILPKADLVPMDNGGNMDPSALVTLPLRLIPGPIVLDTSAQTSTLKPALVFAWAAILLAAMAIAFVLHRAVLLSERRGAFVSSVTHELRTPLTTFRLYSEMLADDMVTEPVQRRDYLQTLCDESTRLMHLVENVLAYSRIERGRTAGRLETLTAGELAHRVIPRLRQRAAQAGLELDVASTPDADAAQFRADALAVEQILFNLVDNACKYAGPVSDPRRVDLTIKATSRQVGFEVCDHGPGLSPQARKKLFQPFAKSATEAAHSAPGVGLGLALCHRLAREVGGTLEHCQAPGRGACFRLTLRRL